MANSADEAIEKARKHFTSKGKNAEILGASIGESLETMKMKGKPILDSATVIDRAIKTMDAGGNFYGIYQEGMNRLNRTDNMDPEKANIEVRNIVQKYVDMLDSEFNKISNDYSKYRNGIRYAGDEKQKQAYKRYLEAQKKK